MLIPENSNMLEHIESQHADGSGFVDIHCHCLSGLDDGPGSISESMALCRSLVEDRMRTVIATPHQLGRYSECNEAKRIRDAVEFTNAELRHNGIGLQLMAGADVRVDERICQLLESDNILTLADGGKYILLELPHETLFDIGPLIGDLGSMGIEAILSHPERHWRLAKNSEILSEWLERSVHLQITAGSLLGDFGDIAEMFAWRLLEAGCVSLVATDSHDLRYRRPRMTAVYNEIRLRSGETVAKRICIENPGRVVNGLKLIPCAEYGGMPGAIMQSDIN